MKIVQIVPSLEPRHGGPSVSVPRLTRALGRAGHDVALFTTGEVPAALRSDPELSVRTFPRGWPAAACPAPGMQAALFQHAPEVLHSHGLWLRALHHADVVARRRSRPHVISPRGMMSHWAWNHRRGQKMLAGAVLHPGALRRATGWHATSAEEADEIKALGFNQPVCVAPNGVSEPADAERAEAIRWWQQACPDVQQRRTALFYSRFHRKKRVIELIDLWLKSAPRDWMLLMVGMAQDYSPEQLETYIHRASGTGRIRVFSGENTPPPYAVASLFLLPSHSENFGLVIAEAMAHGVPPLVTDTTPWRILGAESAGWCVPWEDFPAALQAVTARPAYQLSDYGSNARRLAARDFSWELSARRLSEFYQELSARAGAPT